MVQGFQRIRPECEEPECKGRVRFKFKKFGAREVHDHMIYSCGKHLALLIQESAYLAVMVRKIDDV